MTTRKVMLIPVLILCLTMIIGENVFAAPVQMPDGGFFDPVYYAQTYPDVAAALGNDANLLYQHYIKCGKAEGRSPYRPNSINPTPAVASASNFILSSNISACNLLVGEAITIKLNVKTTAGLFNINWMSYGTTGCVDLNFTDFMAEKDGSYTSNLTITGMVAGSTSLTLYWAQNPNIKVVLPITVGAQANTNVTATQPAVAPTSPVQSASATPTGDYSYLAGNVFRMVRSQYSNAEALAGYTLPYVGSDGKTYVMVVVDYKIISLYKQTTLYNITDGKTYNNPSHMYDHMLKHTYGAEKASYLKKQNEVLEYERRSHEALASMLSSGVNPYGGIFVPASVLNL